MHENEEIIQQEQNDEVVNVDEKHKQEQGEEIPVAWNEVFNESIVHLKVKKVNGEKRFVKSSGLTKCPHWRKRHPHTYHTKNGPIRKWINPVFINKKKAEEAGLKGGVIKIEK